MKRKEAHYELNASLHVSAYLEGLVAVRVCLLLEDPTFLVVDLKLEQARQRLLQFFLLPFLVVPTGEWRGVHWIYYALIREELRLDKSPCTVNRWLRVLIIEVPL